VRPCCLLKATLCPCTSCSTSRLGGIRKQVELSKITTDELSKVVDSCMKEGTKKEDINYAGQRLLYSSTAEIKTRVLMNSDSRISALERL